MDFLKQLAQYGYDPFDFSRLQGGPAVPTSWNRESSIYGQAMGVPYNINSEIAETERALQMGSLNTADAAAAREYLQSLRLQQQNKDDGYVGSPPFNNATTQTDKWKQVQELLEIKPENAGVGAFEEKTGIPDVVQKAGEFLGGKFQNIGFVIFGLVIVAGGLFLASKGDAVAVIKKAV
jgi:hypothetical protein